MSALLEESYGGNNLLKMGVLGVHGKHLGKNEVRIAFMVVQV